MDAYKRLINFVMDAYIRKKIEVKLFLLLTEKEGFTMPEKPKLNSRSG
jgi:hypothetical protein